MDSLDSKSVVDTIEIRRIMDMIPHRYPFLLVDRVIDLVKGQSATGIKNVTINEPFIQGHFPGHPVMPGVLIVEAMAQTAGVVVSHSLEVDDQAKLFAERRLRPMLRSRAELAGPDVRAYHPGLER